MLWDWEYAFEVLPQLLEGFKLTLLATFLAFSVAISLGLVLALLRRSKRWAISLPTYGASEFVRRTPELVQLYFIFYVLPDYGLTLPALMAGVIGLGLHYSTYTSEIYRAGIDSVPSGQWDAALALDLPRWRVWRSIILPQAIPGILPALGNIAILLFKQTALLSAITVEEVLNVAQQIGSETFFYVEPLTIAAALYFIVSYSSSVGVRALERRVAHA